MITSDQTAEPSLSSVPNIALVLGWLGVVPFAGLALMTVIAPTAVAHQAGSAMISYAAIILGFMGGVQWGLQMDKADEIVRTASGYVGSIIPALIAFAATLIPPTIALWLLPAGFAALLSWDLYRIRYGVGPSWYAALRWQLSVPVIICLLVAALIGQIEA